MRPHLVAVSHPVLMYRHTRTRTRTGKVLVLPSAPNKHRARAPARWCNRIQKTKQFTHGPGTQYEQVRTCVNGSGTGACTGHFLCTPALAAAAQQPTDTYTRETEPHSPAHSPADSRARSTAARRQRVLPQLRVCVRRKLANPHGCTGAFHMIYCMAGLRVCLCVYARDAFRNVTRRTRTNNIRQMHGCVCFFSILCLES